MDSDDQSEPLVNNTYTKGEKQENSCRDPFFSLLFTAHLIVMLSIAFSWGTDAYDADYSPDDDDDLSSINYEGMIKLGLSSAGVAVLITMIIVSLMMCFVEFIIKMSLIMTLVVSLYLLISCAIAGNVWGAVAAGLLVFLNLCYMKLSWARIPFAAENLRTGVKAIRANAGIYLWVYLFSALAVGYTCVWTLVVIGCDDVTDGPLNGGYIFLLLLALFWTQQVISNTIHTTVAGVVGTWWFEPAKTEGCCAPAVRESVFRSCTFSFGSICFGSLLVAIIEALRSLLYSMRDGSDGSGQCLYCIIDCLLGCIEGMLQYFNKWAFVYVGLYGYSYVEAGRRVSELFESRGFSTVISDTLVSNVFSLIVLVVGLLTGYVAYIIEEANEMWFDGWDDPESMAILVGFIVGCVMSSINIRVISSSVDAVLVCFAEGPADLEKNHPDTFEAMKEKWSESYPGLI